MTTGEQLRQQRLNYALAQLASEPNRLKQDELLRNILSDCRQLRIAPVERLRQCFAPAAATDTEGGTLDALATTAPAPIYTCCGKTFANLAAYTGHRNSKFHRDAKVRNQKAPA